MMKSQMRFAICLTLGLLFIGGPLAASGADESGTGKVELRYMTTQDWSNEEDPQMVIYNTAYEQFKTEHPEIEIQMELVPWEQMYSQSSLPTKPALHQTSSGWAPAQVMRLSMEKGPYL